MRDGQTATRERLRRFVPYRATRWARRAVEHLSYPSDMESADLKLYSAVAPFTMTCPERVVALRDAVRYVVDREIRGAMVECGVWRGGSMMVMARTLQELGDTRDLYLYDTFEGMTAPTVEDVSWTGESADQILQKSSRRSGRNVWCIAGIDDVRRNVFSTGYPPERIHLVEGKVEDTLQNQPPEEIALLRLDTDFYSSTLHELEILYPRLASGGVLIIDDYGHWQGARRAVDEFFDREGDRPFLTRVDYTCRIAIKS